MLLDGQTAFITGGGGRLGRAIARSCQREGAAVVIADLNLAAAKAVAADLASSGRTAAVAGDVSRKDDVLRMVDEAEAALGLPDILINAHGIFPNIPVLEVEVDDWDRIFAINVRGTMLPVQTFAQRWIDRGVKGSIVNLSSGAATSARAGGAGYNGSKAAVSMMTEVMAIEFGPHGIRVNAVAPGLVMDEVWERDSGADLHPYAELMLRGTPLGRTGHPDDIAEAVTFLASSKASPWTTGSILKVTGGSHCGRTHMPLSRNMR
ncbi:SDR family NAD(P)-dependent oxidoreductase [Chelatococcus asaccharovorans]|uniref:NAD(P)-dependent dehydrogenase (Short-subunit alcohol dehydrogenase family) n=1 Tax=Chelatococcus asaccharovorans TaxID=28210 RepID=A0A2V3UDJ8_9HYPH|nr:glucose 1-dehydrogenase [Chelatococcus asaccharovorans]MBS7707181.1 glucose 1-dehydrogenase [Chelatococcus asaccharovorans]PXW63363.1 NAD(P)-dependent dehydrogenase (short-subunit alcohol dehydrogenase family) [Chelatococcus asaccharovorans]